MPEKKDLLKELRIDRSAEDRRAGGWLWLLLAIPVVLLALGGWWW